MKKAAKKKSTKSKIKKQNPDDLNRKLKDLKGKKVNIYQTEHDYRNGFETTLDYIIEGILNFNNHEKYKYTVIDKHSKYDIFFNLKDVDTIQNNKITLKVIK
jgi:hypothetical protein